MSAGPEGTIEVADQQRDRLGSAALFAGAAIALGYAIQHGNGTGNATTLTYLTIALVATIAGVALPRREWAERYGTRAIVVIAGVGLLAHFYALGMAPPGGYLRMRPGVGYNTFVAGLALLAVLCGAALSEKPWLGRLTFPALLAVHFGLGVWLLRASPAPHIDVWVWHNEAFSELAAGRNPYSGTMPDIYGRGHDWVYGRGLLVNGRVQTGFPYPPLSLALAWLGKVTGGDYRYANLAAITATGALLGYARPGRVAFAGAALFLTTPRWLFVLEQGWTDVYPAFFLALSVFVAVRVPRTLPWVLGLWAASKQYIVLAAPIVPVLWGRWRGWRPVARDLGIAAAVAALLTLPFALFDFSGFWRSVVAFQGRQPFRPDSLSYVALWVRWGGPQVLWLGFLMLPVVYALTWLRAPRTPAGLAASTGLLFMLFFAFSKQAFANYYFFVVAALCAAVSCTASEEAAAAPPTASR